ncbi:MAG: DUF4380 domain-containing protein [Anaerolineae bacterium]
MSASGCVVERGLFRGWDAVYLRNGLVTLAAVPDIGGRIMAYDLAGYPFLFVDPTLAGQLFSPEENWGDGSLNAWKNYGGDKTWPAPQGWEGDDQWHGPPDPVLDSGRYRLADLGATADRAWLEMVSAADPRTGVQIGRKVTLLAGASRVNLELTFTNTLDRVTRWSIWDVVQLRAERLLDGGGLAAETACAVSVPLNPRSRFARGYNVMFGAADNPQWQVDAANQLFIAPYLWEIGKVGIDSAAGWVAFSNDAAGCAFTASFDVADGAEYPDGGATVEAWTVGRGKVGNFDYERSPVYLMEIEVLSPLFTFAPGESRTFSIRWGACRCDGPVVAVTSAGCVAAPLRAEQTSDGVRLSGAFGVFDPGALQVAAQDAQGQPLKTLDVQAVNPMTPIHLDMLLDLPDGAAACALYVTADRDGARRLLACAPVTGPGAAG